MKKTSRDVIILNLCNKKAQSYDVCLHRYGVLALFCHFRKFFAFLPHYWPQKLKFGKNIKKYLNILSFYTCVPLIKIIWCMVPEIWSSTDRIFLSSWVFFCPFTPPPNTLKNENIKNEKKQKNKKTLEISSFYTSLPKLMIICYTVPEIWHDGYNCYFHFGLSIIFPSTVLQPVNGCKTSVLNWVIKFNLIKTLYEIL